MDEQQPARKERIADAKRRVDELKATAEARLAQERARRGWVRLAVRAWERDRDRAGGLLAGGLAYRIFLWQLPTALVLVAVTRVTADVSNTDPSQVMQDMGLTAAVAAAVGQAVEETGTSTWLLLLLGLWGMAWAGRGAARALRVVSAVAYETRPEPVSVTRMTALFNGLMLSAMLLQLVSVDRFGDSVFGQLLVIVVASGGTFAIVTWALTLLPRGERPWTVVLPGSVLFALSLLGVRVAISLYFADRVDRVESVYGSIGVAIVILLALYLGARVFVWGTFLSATFAGVGSGGESLDVAATVLDAYARPRSGETPKDEDPGSAVGSPDG